jgi:hypothetical protein
MNKHHLYWSLLIGACLLLVACHDRRDPVKPTAATTPAIQQPA